MKKALVLSLTALLPAAFASAAAPKAPATLDATCVAFTWSEEGNDGEPIPPLFYPKKITFNMNERIELFRTEHAIYQAVLSSARPKEVFLDVLHLNGTRIAGGTSEVVIGPDVAEPGVHVQYECISETASKNAHPLN